jgi:aldehyde dehydrogenase (NAD+)
VHEYDKLYIDGAWVAPQGSGSTEVINATTEEVMGRIPTGNAADVDTAVAAARRAFETWSAQPLDERLKYVQRLAEELGARTDEIAACISGEVGMPINFSKMIQAGLPAGTTATVIETAKNFEWEEQIGNSLVVREPIGVVGCITPWNYPLHQIMAKVARPSPPGAPSCSSRARSPRSTPSCSPRSSTTSACRRACSTW